MPITSQVAVRARYDVQNPRILLPRLDGARQPILTPLGVDEPPSVTFVVQDQPAVIAAAGFPANAPRPIEYTLEVSPDDGSTWQALWIHGKQMRLTLANSVIYLPIPGLYRVHRIRDPDSVGMPPVLTLSMWYGTLTHEAAMSLLPWNTRGVDGLQGPPGLAPTLRIHTYPYAPVVTVETNLYDIADITLEGPLVLFFSGGVDGKAAVVRVRQDATGSHPLTYGAGIRIGTDLTPTIALLSTTPLALDYLMVRYCAADTVYDLLAINHGFVP